MVEITAKPDSNLADLPIEQLIGCPECDLLMERVDADLRHKVSCPRCGFTLLDYQPQLFSKCFCLAFSALFMYYPAIFLPILGISALNFSQDLTVWRGVVSLSETNMGALAIPVFLFAILFPLIKLLLQLHVLFSASKGWAVQSGIDCYRIYEKLKEWGMWEVYLLGIIVSVVKMIGAIDITVGDGLMCFLVMLIIQVMLDSVMSPPQIWKALEEKKLARA